jgi:YjbE family integral membrane protein
MTAELIAFLQVILIDLVLAGDNAIVVGIAAAGVPRHRRREVIFWGIGAAVVLRILFALVATQLLAIIGLTLAGGVLLLWVSWKLWRELRKPPAQTEVGAAEAEAEPKSLRTAITQIIMADVSMSLDNVLAVAGVAQDHLWVLAAGLLLSVALMGIASAVIARLLERHHWISYIGLGVIAYVAGKMIYEGGFEVMNAVSAMG